MFADNHDVISLKVYDVDAPEEIPAMQDGNPVTQVAIQGNAILP